MGSNNSKIRCDLSTKVLEGGCSSTKLPEVSKVRTHPSPSACLYLLGALSYAARIWARNLSRDAGKWASPIVHSILRPHKRPLGKGCLGFQAGGRFGQTIAVRAIIREDLSSEFGC